MLHQEQFMKAQCIVFPRPLEATVGQIEIGSPGVGQILTRTLMTGVSTGTETRVFRGEQNDSTFPLIPGYENLGEVIEAGPDAALAVGQRVYVRGLCYDPAPYTMCWGSQVSHALATASACIPVPDGVADERAIYAKVAGISLHGVKRAKVAEGEWVVVVGLGIIGHLVVQHAAIRGAKVIAIDIDEQRRTLAKDAGAVEVLDARAPDAVDRVHAITGGGAAVAFDATGRADTLERTALYLKPRAWDDDPNRCGRLVLQGSVEQPVCLDYMALFRREIDLITPRDCDTADMVDSLALMADGRLRPELIRSQVYSYRDAATAYPRLVDRTAMRVLYRWD
ncbi:MAG: hypothetical protein EA382_07370 [Spirochaetaceae bacterium]|nr:MAG: hypothetical protein EA382_07370 [Spirochaetaceae bacterium]